MGKLLFWLIVIIVALLVARVVSHKTQAAKRPAAPPDNPRFSAPDRNESMVRCAHCGIHLPRSEAYMQQGETWCGAEHAKLGAPR